LRRTSRKKFIEKLVEVVEKELELAENGIIRVQDRGNREALFPPEHRIIEELLKLLGYGGKKVYVHSAKNDIKEVIEQIIYVDYERGLNIFHRGYFGVLKRKLKKMGIEVPDSTIKNSLRKTRTEIKRKDSSNFS